MTKREKQTQAEIMWSKLVLFAADAGTPVVCLEWTRTPERQAMLVARGASKTMNSKHIDGLAKDFCFLADLQDDGTINYKPDAYKSLGEYWEMLGGRWGGRFGDDPATAAIEGWDAGHFEYAG